MKPRMICPRVFLFSQRIALGKAFEKWAQENSASLCWENFVAFLDTNGMLNKEAAMEFLKKEEEHAEDVDDELGGKECPEPEVACAFDGAGNACDEEQGGEQGHHGGCHRDGDRGGVAQAIASHDGIGHQSVGGEDAGQQQGGQQTVVEEVIARHQTQHEGDDGGDDSEGESFDSVLLQVLEVHFQSGQKHDEVDAHLAKQLKRGIARQDVEAMFTNEYTCQNHSDEMGNVQFAENHRGKQCHAEHEEEYPGGVGDGQV